MKTYTIDDAMLLRLDSALHIAARTARKLDASMQRREVMPRYEFEELVAHEREIVQLRAALRALDEKEPGND
jgi:hypothetical protein